MSIDGYTAAEGRFDEVLTLLPRWRRIHSLTTVTRLPAVNERMWNEGLFAVASTLRHLIVTAFCADTPLAEFLLSSVGALQQLETLVIRQFGFPSDLDFAALPSLPRLQRFELCDETPLQVPRCTPAQVDALSRCLALTDLQCGPWMPVFGDDRRMQLTAQQIQDSEEGLVRLMELRFKNGAAPLRRLSLGIDGLMFPQSWHALSLSHEWEELCGHWSCTLTAGDWMRFASFQRLRSIGIMALEFDMTAQEDFPPALLDLGTAFDALLHCGTLQHVLLNGSFTLRSAHVSMLARFPALESFEAHWLSVESLAPLADAPRLTTLALQQCCGLNNAWINIRAMIPSMPTLDSLTIYEREKNRMSAADMKSANDALFARLPRLTPARFVYPR